MQRSTNCYMLVWILLVCTRASIVYVSGDYILQVRTHSYNNPTNRCAGCGDNEGCCDAHNLLECSDTQRCDNYFFYCLLIRVGNTFFCSDQQTSTRFLSERDGGMIDFSQDMVIGLPNPLSLNGLTRAWNGAQLLINVWDFDDFINDDELVDRFGVNIPSTIAPIGVESTTFTYNGTSGFATIQLSFRVVCAPNYFGPDCSDFCDSSTETCVCRPGFTGEFCANIDDCEGITCSENRVCVDGIDSFQCNCNTGFTGAQCEMNIDDCDGVDCNGNGQCIDGINNFTCTCDSGFTSQLCEINIDDCEGNNCSGNGVCVDGFDSFQCNCNNGFTGQLCETNINDCVGVDCSGNGRCNDRINNFTCTCDSGFTGQLCEINIDDCVGVNCSGNGQCEDGVDSFTCVCDPGFTGELCSSSTNGEGGSNRRVGTNIGAIAGGVIGALVGLLLLVLLVILVVVLIVRKQKTKEKQTYKPEHPLPGDNPVYDTTLDPSKAIPVAVPQNGQYANLNTTTMTSPPDHDFQNPLYGSPLNNPPTSTNVTTTIGSTEHDFDNPIYEADTYALPTAATATAIYATPDEPEHYEYLSETATQH